LPIGTIVVTQPGVSLINFASSEIFLSLGIFFESRTPTSFHAASTDSFTYTPATHIGPKKSPLPLSSTPMRGSNNSGFNTAS